jgi:hypothetical protein
MDLDPTYYAWHPSLHLTTEGLTIVTINLTPCSSSSPPSGRAFVVQLLREIGMDVDIVDIRFWNVLAYRSNYHGDLEQSAHWRDRWQKNWRLAVTLENAARLPILQHEYKGTFALSDAQEVSLDDEKTVGCMIISDFKNQNDANTAKKKIQCSRRPSVTNGDDSAPDPEFLTIDLGTKFVQLQIYLGKFATAFYELGADYAFAVDADCRRAGGITSFDQRANEWGELYNPSGIE